MGEDQNMIKTLDIFCLPFPPTIVQNMVSTLIHVMSLVYNTTTVSRLNHTYHDIFSPWLWLLNHYRQLSWESSLSILRQNTSWIICCTNISFIKHFAAKTLQRPFL